MNKFASIDLKSVIIGFLLAILAGFFFGGFGRTFADNQFTITADENGIYIYNGYAIRYIEKKLCQTKNGCNYYGSL